MPEELWTEFHNIVQESMTKTISKKKKCKKAKWLFEEELQTAERKKSKRHNKKVKDMIYPTECTESGSVSSSVMADSSNPKDCSLPGFLVHGILQARILEWIAVPFSRGSSPSRVQTSF